jgi:Ion channel
VASHPARRGNRFGLLLAVLVASYLLSAFASRTWVSAVQVVLFLGVAALAVRTSHVKQRAALPAIAVVTGGSALVGALVLAAPSNAAQGAANIWKALVLAFAVVLIIRRVLAQPTVTLQSLFGALSAYMMVGLLFAACYGAMDMFAGGGFFANGSPGNLQTFQYFSFTTLTTLGYGDFTAAQSGGRAVAVLEAMIGQVFLATLVARLVSAFRPPRRSQANGARDRRGGQARPARPGRRSVPHGLSAAPGARRRRR